MNFYLLNNFPTTAVFVEISAIFWSMKFAQSDF